MIHFICSKCGENIEAPESIRGENLKCPKCGHLQRVSGENPDLMKPLGNIEPICPYCNGSLEKKPKRRCKCPHCGNYFRVRTRPQDRQQVLVTEEQAEEIAKQYWPGYGRDPENWLREKRKTWDQQWGELNRQSGEYAKNGQWGMYRNCRYGLGEVLRAEANFILKVLDFPKESKHGIKAISRIRQAIRMYLEVALFDLNGANNFNEFKPYATKIQLWGMAPAVIDWTTELSTDLGVQRSNLREIFHEVAELYKSFSFPLTTDKAWKLFEEALIEYDVMITTNKNLNEINIRRLYISDQSWEQTSNSWKELRPFRNFDRFDVSDESREECYKRLKPKYNIPLEVIEQWIYPLYYNYNTVNNYGWIDYLNSEFIKTQLTIEQLSKVYVVKNFLSYVHTRQNAQPFNEFICIPVDKHYWKNEYTWRIPPIILDVNSFNQIPKYAEIIPPYQLIEGHSRLGYLLAMQRAGILQKKEHYVYLLKKK